jgi:hypothetical protein
MVNKQRDTSKAVASKAGKILSSKTAPAVQKSVAGSALAQTPKKGAKK